MLSTPHVIVGLAIAKTIPNPIVAIPTAFFSHFALEMIPHWNPHLNTEMRTYGRLTNRTIGVIALDTLTAAGTALYVSNLVSNGDSYMMYTMLASSVAAIAPDLFEVPYFFLHLKNSLLSWWLRIQKSIQSDAEPLIGILTQVTVSLGALWWIFKY